MKKITLLSLLFLVALFSCKNDEKPAPINEPVIKANQFINEAMTLAYYWSDKMPNIDYTKEVDPKKYFEKLIVSEDLYSFISDDAESVLNGFDGVVKSFGYSLSFFEVEKAIVAMVEYVYPDTPASAAGIVRGDAIILMNGAAINNGNYMDLINNSRVEIGVSKIEGGKILPPRTVTMVSEVITETTVHTQKVFDIGDRKVGYLFYTSYVGAQNSALDRVFGEFKAHGVNELILDLRYNRGGDEVAIVNLCSHIAPNVSSRDIIFTTVYNSEFSKLNPNPNNYFKDGVANLGLERIYILTSQSTFSASEVTILGLKPYMEVYTIGEKTGGKYTGMVPLQPAEASIKNWLLVPVVSSWTNKDGKSARGGIAPDYEVNCYEFPFVKIGDEKDPLIAEALAKITGTKSVRVKSTQQSIKPFDYGSSKYDKVRSSLIYK